MEISIRKNSPPKIQNSICQGFFKKKKKKKKGKPLQVKVLEETGAARQREPFGSQQHRFFFSPRKKKRSPLLSFHSFIRFSGGPFPSAFENFVSQMSRYYGERLGDNQLYVRMKDDKIVEPKIYRRVNDDGNHKSLRSTGRKGKEGMEKKMVRYKCCFLDPTSGNGNTCAQQKKENEGEETLLLLQRLQNHHTLRRIQHQSMRLERGKQRHWLNVVDTEKLPSCESHGDECKDDKLSEVSLHSWIPKSVTWMNARNQQQAGKRQLQKQISALPVSSLPEQECWESDEERLCSILESGWERSFAAASTTKRREEANPVGFYDERTAGGSSSNTSASTSLQHHVVKKHPQESTSDNSSSSWNRAFTVFSCPGAGESDEEEEEQDLNLSVLPPKVSSMLSDSPISTKASASNDGKQPVLIDPTLPLLARTHSKRKKKARGMRAQKHDLLDRLYCLERKLSTKIAPLPRTISRKLDNLVVN